MSQKRSRLTNCRFTTISSQISAIYMNIFHKTEVQTVMGFRTKFFGQRCLFGRNWYSAENAFLGKNTFVKFEVAFWPEMSFLLEIFFFQMNLYSFSKYWKVWLAFNGWKLSGLFFVYLQINWSASMYLTEYFCIVQSFFDTKQ